jgi:hypothetical protein
MQFGVGVGAVHHGQYTSQVKLSYRGVLVSFQILGKSGVRSDLSDHMSFAAPGVQNSDSPIALT